MAVCAPKLLTMLVLFLWALQHYQAVAEPLPRSMFPDGGGCNPGTKEKIKRAFGDVKLFGKAGSERTRSLMNPEVDEKVKRQITRALHEMFGVSVGTDFNEKPLKSIEGMGAKRRSPS